MEGKVTQKTNCLEIKKRKEKRKIKMMITKGKIEKTAKKKKKKKKKRTEFPGRSYPAPKPVRELLSTRSISNSGPGQIENYSYFVIRARDLFALVERLRLPIDHLETLWFHTINFRCIEFLNTGKGWGSFFWLRVQLTFQTQMRGKESFKGLTGTI